MRDGRHSQLPSFDAWAAITRTIATYARFADEAEGRRRYTHADHYVDTLVRVEGRWLFYE